MQNTHHHEMNGYLPLRPFYFHRRHHQMSYRNWEATKHVWIDSLSDANQGVCVWVCERERDRAGCCTVCQLPWGQFILCCYKKPDYLWLYILSSLPIFHSISFLSIQLRANSLAIPGQCSWPIARFVCMHEYILYLCIFLFFFVSWHQTRCKRKQAYLCKVYAVVTPHPQAFSWRGCFTIDPYKPQKNTSKMIKYMELN